MDNYFPAPGTLIEDLDTPCLLLDLDAAESNFSVVAETYRNTECKMRQHTKNIKSALVARKQIEFGGTVGGVCTAKLAEAEMMVQGGIPDILIANQVVAHDKIIRLCTLNKIGDVKVCVDNPINVRQISEIAAIQGVTIGLLIEVDTSMSRAGIRSVSQGVPLARLITKLPNVKFRGVMSHQALGEYTGEENRVLTAKKHIQKCLDVKKTIEEAGLPVEMVSSGESFSYDTAARMPGVTEVEGGTYALMATRYSYLKEFHIANKIITTIVSVKNGVAIGDVGTQAVSVPSGEMPRVELPTGITVESIEENHIIFQTSRSTTLSVGDKVILVPWYQDMMVNRWDHYIVVRKGVVEAVWPIEARGCFH